MSDNTSELAYTALLSHLIKICHELKLKVNFNYTLLTAMASCLMRCTHCAQIHFYKYFMIT